MVITKIKSLMELARIKELLLVCPFVFTIAFTSSDNLIPIDILLFDFLAVGSGFAIGNILNGITDADIDLKNPRTSTRPMAKGDVSIFESVILILVLGMVLLYSTYRINPFYFFLLPIPAILIIAYSFTKRFTWACHLVIGLINGAVPFSTWGIINGWIDWRIILCGAIMFFWTVGFDILYSCQDYKYDKEQGLYSIPVKFGQSTAIKISLINYFLMFLSFYLYMISTCCGLVFVIGLICGYIIIIVQLVYILKDVKYVKCVLKTSRLFCTWLAVLSIVDYFYR